MIPLNIIKKKTKKTNNNKLLFEVRWVLSKIPETKPPKFSPKCIKIVLE